MLLIFDIDGVLVDSSQITIDIIQKLLQEFDDIEDTSAIKIESTFGMTCQDMWDDLMPGYSDEIKGKASAEYEQRIVEALKVNQVLLPAVRETLESLKAQGYLLTTASNCETAYMDAVLDTQRIRKYFTDPQCLETVNGKEKSETIKYHLERNFEKCAIHIGDRYSDVLAAHKNNIPVIGCASRFTKKDELDKADACICSIKELINMELDSIIKKTVKRS